MSTAKTLPAISIIGDEHPFGTYVLRLHASKTERLTFGRFKNGEPIKIESGDYCYVGSQVDRNGGARLASRLLRHATRSEGKPPHKIRETLSTHCENLGWGSGPRLPKNGKKLHWNVDHLLDLDTVELTHAIVLRSPQRLEAKLGAMLAEQPETVIFEPGLGANDIPGNTHLLRVEADESWWLDLPEKLRALVERQ
jgi:Uri superfamily endonuclease